MGGKNTASKATGGIKISELGEELRVDPRQIVAAAQEAAMENAKVPASWVTAGQADRLRAKFGGQGELKAKIERKLRHFESALETPTEAPKVEAPKSQGVKLGKRTFEADRRAIFGVVARPDTTLNDKPGTTPSSESVAHKNESESAIKADALSSPATVPEVAEVAPPIVPPGKKFLQVTVAPPIRREAGAADPRFGVIVPSPDANSKESSGAIWGNLKDGSAPVDFSTSAEDDARALKEAEFKKAEARAELEATREAKAHAEPKKEGARRSSRRAKVAAPEAESPDIDRKPERASSTGSDETPMHKRTLDVPVKWQPKNKAFGAKHTHKSKVLKQLESQSDDKVSAKASKEKTPKRPAPEKPQRHTESVTSQRPEPKRQSERKQAESPPPEGVLKRLIRKIFNK